MFTQSWSKAWIDSTEGICCPAHILDNASQAASEVYFDVGVSWDFSSVFMLNWMSQGRIFVIIDIWYLISLDLKCSGYVLVERILFEALRSWLEKRPSQFLVTDIFNNPLSKVYLFLVHSFKCLF